MNLFHGVILGGHVLLLLELSQNIHTSVIKNKTQDKCLCVMMLKLGCDPFCGEQTVNVNHMHLLYLVT